MMTDHAHPGVLAPVLASWAAVLAVVTGAMVLVGWVFDIAALKSVLPGWVAMKANAAVCFILTGIALLLTARSPATFNPRLSTFIFRFARLCVLLVGLIGLLTLGEYVFGWNPGLDQWLFHEPGGAVGTTYPGRMAPEMALCFVLLAAALWLAGGSRKTRGAILASGSFGLLVTTLALASMLSYLTPGLGSFGWFGLTIMALHAAILFSMLGTAVIAISWRQDVLPWSLGRNATAAFACGMALLVIINFNTNRSQFRLAEVDRKIAYSEEVLGYTKSILIEVIDTQAHIHSYVITGDERFKNHYLEAKASGKAKLDALRKLVIDDLHQQQQFARIEERVEAQFEWFQQIIDVNWTGMTVAARNNMISHGEDLLDRLRITFDQVENEQQQIIRELKQEFESVSLLFYLIISLSTLTSLLIFLTVIFKLNFVVVECKRTEREIEFKSTILQTQQDTSLDAILVVDENLQIISYNQQFIDLWRLSPQLVSARLDAPVLQSVVEQVENPKAFVARVQYLYAHRDDKSREEVQLKDGRIVDRYSTPITGADGKYYGRIWYFRDITERKLAQEALRISRENLHRLLNSIVEGAYGVDTNGNCTFVNQAFLQMLGYQNDGEVLGKHVHELMHHSHADGSPYPANECRSYDAYRLNKSINVSDEVFWRKDGVAIPVEYWAQPIVSGGVMIGAIVTFMDITERKQAEAKLLTMTNVLRESQQLLDSIVEHIPVMVFVKRASDLRFELFNRAGEKLLGYSRSDLLGKGNYDLWPKEQGDWFTAEDRKVLASEDVTEILEEPINTASGETRYLHTWKVALRDESGEPAHLLGISIDITEHKKAEARLAEQLDELRRWHDVTSGREGRVLNLKHEVNELLGQTGKQPRYPSAESKDPIEE